MLHTSLAGDDRKSGRTRNSGEIFTELIKCPTVTHRLNAKQSGVLNLIGRHVQPRKTQEFDIFRNGLLRLKLQQPVRLLGLRHRR